MIQLKINSIPLEDSYLIFDNPIILEMTPFTQTLFGESYYFQVKELDLSGFASSRQSVISTVEATILTCWETVKDLVSKSDSGTVVGAFLYLSSMKEDEELRAVIDYMLSNCQEVDEETYNSILEKEYIAEFGFDEESTKALDFESALLSTAVKTLTQKTT